jgi:hypothetical protein
VDINRAQEIIRENIKNFCQRESRLLWSISRGSLKDARNY